MAPYQKVAFVCYLSLPVFIVVNYYLLPDRLPDWLGTIAWVLAGYLLIAFFVEGYLLVSDYLAGRLFPLRNMTFFVTVFSLVAVPLLGVFFWMRGEYYAAPTVLLIPVFFYYCVTHLHFVRIDKVSLQAKTGFGAPVDVPLFGLERIEVGEEEIVADAGSGVGIRLLRGYFFKKDWQQLRRRMKELQN